MRWLLFLLIVKTTIAYLYYEETLYDSPSIYPKDTNTRWRLCEQDEVAVKHTIGYGFTCYTSIGGDAFYKVSSTHTETLEKHVRPCTWNEVSSQCGGRESAPWCTRDGYENGTSVFHCNTANTTLMDRWDGVSPNSRGYGAGNTKFRRCEGRELSQALVLDERWCIMACNKTNEDECRLYEIGYNEVFMDPDEATVSISLPSTLLDRSLDQWTSVENQTAREQSYFRPYAWCTEEESIQQCLPNWQLDPTRRPCTRTGITHYNQVLGHTYSYNTTQCNTVACSPRQQLERCGHYTHRCSFYCPHGNYTCVETGDCLHPSTDPVRWATHKEWQLGSRPNQALRDEEIRVRCQDQELTLGCITEFWDGQVWSNQSMLTGVCGVTPGFHNLAFLSMCPGNEAWDVSNPIYTNSTGEYCHAKCPFSILAGGFTNFTQCQPDSQYYQEAGVDPCNRTPCNVTEQKSTCYGYYTTKCMKSHSDITINRNLTCYEDPSKLPGGDTRLYGLVGGDDVPMSQYFSDRPVRPCTSEEWRTSCAKWPLDCRVSCQDENFTTDCRREVHCPHTVAGLWLVEEDGIYWTQCTAAEYWSTCAESQEWCRKVCDDPGLTQNCRYESKCPQYQSWLINRPLEITDTLVPFPCTEFESYVTCNSSWTGTTEDERTSGCFSSNCQYRYAFGGWVNCQLKEESCLWQPCDEAHQLEYCGGYSHTCQMQCADHNWEQYCKYKPNSCGGSPSPSPVRECTPTEMNQTCTNITTNCRARCPQGECIIEARCPWSEAEWDPVPNLRPMDEGLGFQSCTDSQSEQYCGPRWISDSLRSGCKLRTCEYTWHQGLVNCTIVPDSCICPRTRSSGKVPCALSSWPVTRQSPDPLVTRYCGTYTASADLTCSGLESALECRIDNCECQPTTQGGYPVIHKFPPGYATNYSKQCSGLNLGECNVTETLEVCGLSSANCYHVGTSEPLWDGRMYLCECLDGVTGPQGTCDETHFDGTCNSTQLETICGPPSNGSESCQTYGNQANVYSCKCNSTSARHYQTLRCVGESFTRPCNDSEWTSLIIPCNRPRPDCQVRCYGNGSCPVIRDTCYVATETNQTCTDEAEVALCGGWSSLCMVNTTTAPDIGLIRINESTVTCVCNTTLMLEYLNGTTTDESQALSILRGRDRLHRPCPNPWLFTQTCSYADTYDFCGYGGEYIHTRTYATDVLGNREHDSDSCMRYTNHGNLVSGSCPFQYELRNCTQVEEMRWCSHLPRNETGCLAGCPNNPQYPCFRFGDCHHSKVETNSVFCDQHCPPNTNVSTYPSCRVHYRQTKDGRQVTHVDECVAQCRPEWEGPNCDDPSAWDPCTDGMSEVYCGLPEKVQECRYYNKDITGVRCTCQEPYGWLPRKETILIDGSVGQTAVPVFKMCDGVVRSCDNQTEVLRYVGTGYEVGSTCTLLCDPQNLTHCRALDWNCSAQGSLLLDTRFTPGEHQANEKYLHDTGHTLYPIMNQPCGNTTTVETVDFQWFHDIDKYRGEIPMTLLGVPEVNSSYPPNTDVHFWSVLSQHCWKEPTYPFRLGVVYQKYESFQIVYDNDTDTGPVNVRSVPDSCKCEPGFKSSPFSQCDTPEDWYVRGCTQSESYALVPPSIYGSDSGPCANFQCRLTCSHSTGNCWFDPRYTECLERPIQSHTKFMPRNISKAQCGETGVATGFCSYKVQNLTITSSCGQVTGCICDHNDINVVSRWDPVKGHHCGRNYSIRPCETADEIVNFCGSAANSCTKRCYDVGVARRCTEVEYCSCRQGRTPEFGDPANSTRATYCGNWKIESICELDSTMVNPYCGQFTQHVIYPNDNMTNPVCQCRPGMVGFDGTDGHVPCSAYIRDCDKSDVERLCNGANWVDTGCQLRCKPEGSGTNERCQLHGQCSTRQVVISGPDDQCATEWTIQEINGTNHLLQQCTYDELRSRRRRCTPDEAQTLCGVGGMCYVSIYDSSRRVGDCWCDNVNGIHVSGFPHYCVPTLGYTRECTTAEALLCGSRTAIQCRSRLVFTNEKHEYLTWLGFYRDKVDPTLGTSANVYNKVDFYYLSVSLYPGRTLWSTTGDRYMTWWPECQCYSNYHDPTNSTTYWTSPRDYHNLAIPVTLSLSNPVGRTPGMSCGVGAGKMHQKYGRCPIENGQVCNNVGRCRRPPLQELINQKKCSNYSIEKHKSLNYPLFDTPGYPGQLVEFLATKDTHVYCKRLQYPQSTITFGSDCNLYHTTTVCHDDATGRFSACPTTLLHTQKELDLWPQMQRVGLLGDSENLKKASYRIMDDVLSFFTSNNLTAGAVVPEDHWTLRRYMNGVGARFVYYITYISGDELYLRWFSADADWKVYQHLSGGRSVDLKVYKLGGLDNTGFKCIPRIIEEPTYISGCYHCTENQPNTFESQIIQSFPEFNQHSIFRLQTKKCTLHERRPATYGVSKSIKWYLHPGERLYVGDRIQVGNYWFGWTDQCTLGFFWRDHTIGKFLHYELNTKFDFVDSQKDVPCDPNLFFYYQNDGNQIIAREESGGGVRILGSMWRMLPEHNGASRDVYKTPLFMDIDPREGCFRYMQSDGTPVRYKNGDGKTRYPGRFNGAFPSKTSSKRGLLCINTTDYPDYAESFNTPGYVDPYTYMTQVVTASQEFIHFTPGMGACCAELYSLTDLIIWARGQPSGVGAADAIKDAVRFNGPGSYFDTDSIYIPPEYDKACVVKMPAWYVSTPTGDTCPSTYQPDVLHKFTESDLVTPFDDTHCHHENNITMCECARGFSGSHCLQLNLATFGNDPVPPGLANDILIRNKTDGTTVRIPRGWKGACGEGYYDVWKEQCICHSGAVTKNGICVKYPCPLHNEQPCGGPTRGTCGLSGCTCLSGYIGANCGLVQTSATTCNTANDCKPSGLVNGQPYRYSRGFCSSISHTCTCYSGPYGRYTGTKCDQVEYLPDTPTSRRCQHGTLGVLHENTERERPGCVCDPSWTGPFCNITRCPMANGKVCNGVPGACHWNGYAYACAGPVTKPDKCEGKYLECNGNSKYRGCACEYRIEDFCAEPGTGQICGISTSPTECVSARCQFSHDAQMRGRYSCHCPGGVNSTYCEEQTCPKSPINGQACGGSQYGQCLSDGTCRCRLGYLGDSCQHDVNDACVWVADGLTTLGKLCANQGQCVQDDQGEFYCKCNPGILGAKCDGCFKQTVGTCEGGYCDGNTQCICPPKIGYNYTSGNCEINLCSIYNNVPIDAIPTEDGSGCRCVDPTLVYSNGCVLPVLEPPAPQPQLNVTANATFPPPVMQIDEPNCTVVQTPDCPGYQNVTIPDPVPQIVDCPRTPDGSLCGYSYAHDIELTPGYHRVNDTARKQCNRTTGTCLCGLGYSLNQVTGLCESVCHLTQTQFVVRRAGAVTNETVDCRCFLGWNATSLCYDEVCSNGGTLNSYDKCDCPSLFTGDYCQVAACKNGGTPTGDSTCTCTAGFTGTYCETAICGSIKMANDPEDQSKCVCRTPWTNVTNLCEEHLCHAPYEPASDASTECYCGGVSGLDRLCRPPCPGGKTRFDNGTCRPVYVPSCGYGSICYGVKEDCLERIGPKCICAVGDMWLRDPADSNRCTINRCGAHGVPHTNDCNGVCQCEPGYHDIGGCSRINRCVSNNQTETTGAERTLTSRDTDLTDRQVAVVFAPTTDEEGQRFQNSLQLFTTPGATLDGGQVYRFHLSIPLEEVPADFEDQLTTTLSAITGASKYRFRVHVYQSGSTIAYMSIDGSTKGVSSADVVRLLQETQTCKENTFLQYSYSCPGGPRYWNGTTNTTGPVIASEPVETLIVTTPHNRIETVGIIVVTLIGIIILAQIVVWFINYVQKVESINN